MMESSEGDAEVVSSEFQQYRILYFARAKGGARAPCAPPWIRHWRRGGGATASHAKV